MDIFLCESEDNDSQHSETVENPSCEVEEIDECFDVSRQDQNHSDERLKMTDPIHRIHVRQQSVTPPYVKSGWP